MATSRRHRTKVFRKLFDHNKLKLIRSFREWLVLSGVFALSAKKAGDKKAAVRSA
jgi:hypothetical protein